MFQLVTGNILESSAKCLVNTVNCEGYMGKGIAYQFKLRFPENNHDYMKSCKSGTLKIGTIHSFRESDKLIVNFPTKNKWREKTKIEYIHKGLSELVQFIPLHKVKSIAIPPLGCGNGGLNWSNVKPLIIQYLEPLLDTVDIQLYEPSKNFEAKSTLPPKINFSHLVLMNIKVKLKKFGKLRLQKAAYFMNLFLEEKYFFFKSYKLGPYAYPIELLSKEIKQFQKYHNANTDEALEIGLKTLISQSVHHKMDSFKEAINQAAYFTNSISTDKELELLSSICFILESKEKCFSEENIVREIKSWSQEKADKFAEADILHSISYLLSKNIIEEDLMGYSVAKRHKTRTF
ncbi:MAG: Appr-1-p processing protein [bacterium]|nr:MAG: Appr-1-p processing protein [bacterium]